jgi:hypothetical protein
MNRDAQIKWIAKAICWAFTTRTLSPRRTWKEAPKDVREDCIADAKAFLEGMKETLAPPSPRPDEVVDYVTGLTAYQAAGLKPMGKP